MQITSALPSIRHSLCLRGGESVAAFRYDIVKEAGQWVVATGGPTWRGFLSRAAAVDAAMRAAKDLEVHGSDVEVYLWEGRTSTKIH